MAAGLGFKTFTTGEVLTAADVNGYLMQGVLVFASEAARDAAITSPQEGQFAYTKDNNSLWYYTGSAWAASGATGDIEGVTAGTGISGGGTSGTVTITNSMATAIDAKGDLVVGTGADTFARLAVGANDTVLVAASGEATGLKWAAPAASSGPAFSVYRNQSQTLTSGTWVKVQFEVEDFDTDSCYDNVTNYRFTPNKSGYYQFNYNAQAESGFATLCALYKNGSVYHFGFKSNPGSSQNNHGNGSFIAYANGTTDYFEVFLNPGSGYGGTAVVNWGTDRRSAFSGVWIRS